MKKEVLEKRKRSRDELYQKVEQGELKIAEAVKLIRETYGLSQQEFANKVGVSKFSVTSIETNKGNPTIKSVNKMLAPMKLTLRVDKES